MNQSIELRQQLRDSINQDIADRTKMHQDTIAGLRSAGSPSGLGPLVMLAHGDSWFDYPLTGNGLPMVNTDVIAQLGSMGVTNPVILNLSHHGDATSDEMSLPKQQRMIDSLRDPSNWMDHGKPDAILFSGGGNDIAGNQFCIFLDHSDTPGSTGLNDERFQKILGCGGGIVPRFVCLSRQIRPGRAHLRSLLRLSHSRRHRPRMRRTVAQTFTRLQRMETLAGRRYPQTGANRVQGAAGQACW